MKTIDTLFERAKAIIENSYSPYSNFRVECAIELNDGNIITGVNVENAAYGLANCAERTAIFTAIANGYKKGDIVKLLVLTDKNYYVSPCGSCRQVIQELVHDDAYIILATANKEYKMLKKSDLLPYSFTESDL